MCELISADINQPLAEYSKQNGTDVDLFILREESCLCFPLAEVISSAGRGGLIPGRLDIFY